jgi:hypothetical protein
MNELSTAQGQLPVYAAGELAGLDPEELLNLLIRNEDRVPRALIDECARRGEAMVERFATLLERDEFWNGEAAAGEWWLRLHAAMILGLIPGERAGSLLVALMRRMDQAGDHNLQDWLSGYWPALFRNKPDGVEPLLRELAQDRGIDWYMRIQAIESLISLAERRGAEALEASLDWAASIAADESDDWDLRLSAANTLLDLPRVRHRALLENLAARQSGWGVQFSMDDVRDAFSGPDATPQWRDGFDDPWKFYAPGSIARRQARWAKEDAKDLAREAFNDTPAFNDAPAPYVRAAPKVGRNDPCPCGSGKKYKKCCL